MPFYFLLSALWVAVDQVVKYLVRTYIPLYASVPFLPGMDLTYVQNTGAAFSLFSDHTWILALISLVMSVLLAIAVWKPLFRHPFGRTALALLLGGAVGNLIDRALLGFVTDMFETTFVHFAIFNVADIGVVVGGILLCLHVIFAFGKGWKEEKEEEENP